MVLILISTEKLHFDHVQRDRVMCYVASLCSMHFKNFDVEIFI